MSVVDSATKAASAGSYVLQATSHTEPGISLLITEAPLDYVRAISSVRSPAAGATVVFVGTTRDNFAGKQVKSLSYSAYVPRAMRSMLAIAKDLLSKHDLQAISIQHRLGPVAIGEESIVIAVSAAHRTEGWRAGEEALELCKDRVEIWKLEKLEGEDGEGTYKANRDGKMGLRVD